MIQEAIDDSLKQKLLEYANSLETKVDQVGNFAESEIPLVIQEYVSWLFYESTCWAAILVVIMLIVSVVYRWLFINLSKKLEGNDDKLAAQSVVTGIFAGTLILLLIGMCQNLVYAVKCCVAPRVIVLEKIMDIFQ